VQAAGPHIISWSGNDEAWNRVTSGIYFLVLLQEGKRHVQKMLFLKNLATYSSQMAMIAAINRIAKQSLGTGAKLPDCKAELCRHSRAQAGAWAREQNYQIAKQSFAGIGVPKPELGHESKTLQLTPARWP